MFKNYTLTEQMQNELQWWGEQLQQAIIDDDEKGIDYCNNVINKLIIDIQSEKNTE